MRKTIKTRDGDISIETALGWKAVVHMRRWAGPLSRLEIRPFDTAAWFRFGLVCYTGLTLEDLPEVDPSLVKPPGWRHVLSPQQSPDPAPFRWHPYSAQFLYERKGRGAD